MATSDEKELLKDTCTIILFYSDGCKHCVNYKKDNWPKLVKAAKKRADIYEINVADSENEKIEKIISRYHEGGIPNTVFLDDDDEILISNPGNFDTSRLAQEFESMGNDQQQKFGYKVTRRREP